MARSYQTPKGWVASEGAGHARELNPPIIHIAGLDNVTPTQADTIIRQLAQAGLNPPQAVTLAITNRCNLSCSHCWPDSGTDENAPLVPKAQILRLIDGFAALGAEKIVITGGEPLIHPDWFELLAFAFDRRGIGEVRLQTNAILITPVHVEAFLSFKDRGLIIQTSLEGATPPFHDRVRGKGSFDQTLQGIRLLEKGGLAQQVCIAFTEMRHNFEDIPDLLKLADDMGIGQFVSGTLVPGGRAAQPGRLVPPTPAQYEKLLSRFQSDQAFRDRYHRIGNIATLEWFIDTTDAAGPCCTFIETPYITAEGNLYPCVMLHANDAAARRVFDRSLATAISEKIDVWSRLQEINQSRVTQLDTCKACPDYAGCGAGCMGRAYAAYGNYFTVEDRCRLRKAVYRRRSNGS